MSTPATPASSGGAAPQNGMGTAALVLGILGILGCFPLLFPILAIVFGKMGMGRAEQGLATNGGAAKAGFWLGIVGLVLWLLLLIIGFATGMVGGMSN